MINAVYYQNLPKRKTSIYKTFIVILNAYQNLLIPISLNNNVTLILNRSQWLSNSM